MRSSPGLTPSISAGDQPLLMGLRDEQWTKLLILSSAGHVVTQGLQLPRGSWCCGGVLSDLGTSSIRGLSRGCNLQGQNAKGWCPTRLQPQLLLHPVIYCSKPLSTDYKVLFNCLMVLYFFCCQLYPLAQLALHSPWCYVLALFIESTGIHSGIFSQSQPSSRCSSQTLCSPALLRSPYCTCVVWGSLLGTLHAVFGSRSYTCLVPQDINAGYY